MAMKVQYFGDVNDYRKFALLRALSEVGEFRIGVCWMLTEADSTGYGDKRELFEAARQVARLRSGVVRRTSRGSLCADE